MCSVIVRHRWCAKVIELGSSRTASSYGLYDPISMSSCGFLHPVRLLSSLAIGEVQMVNWYPLSSASRSVSARIACSARHARMRCDVPLHERASSQGAACANVKAGIHVMIGPVKTPRSCMGCLAHRQRRHECQQNVDSTCTVDQKHQTRRPCLFVIHAEIERRPAPKADNVENPLVVFNSIIFEAHTALRLQVPAFRQAEGSMGTVT